MALCTGSKGMIECNGYWWPILSCSITTDTNGEWDAEIDLEGNNDSIITRGSKIKLRIPAGGDTEMTLTGVIVSVDYSCSKVGALMEMTVYVASCPEGMIFHKPSPHPGSEWELPEPKLTEASVVSVPTNADAVDLPQWFQQEGLCATGEGVEKPEGIISPIDKAAVVAASDGPIIPIKEKPPIELPGGRRLITLED